MEPFLKQRAYKIGDWNGVRALLENPYPSFRLAKARATTQNPRIATVEPVSGIIRSVGGISFVP